MSAHHTPAADSGKPQVEQPIPLYAIGELDVMQLERATGRRLSEADRASVTAVGPCLGTGMTHPNVLEAFEREGRSRRRGVSRARV